MSITLVIAILVAVGLAFLVASRFARPSSRRCPTCSYDLRATSQPPCPECGTSWSSERTLTSIRRRNYVRVGLLAWLIAGVVIGVSLRHRHWTELVPRPLLAAILELSVSSQPIINELPSVEQGLWQSTSRWERYVWQEQAAEAVEYFLSLVDESDGSFESVESLVPAAIEAHALVQRWASTSASEAWPLRRIVNRSRERRGLLDRRSDAAIGTWVASELQYNAVANTYPGWITPPMPLMIRLARSSDVTVRAYVVDRIKLVYTEEARGVLEGLASDPDATVRSRANEALEWRSAFRIDVDRRE